MPCFAAAAAGDGGAVGNSNVYRLQYIDLKIGRYWISRMLNNIQHRFVERANAGDEERWIHGTTCTDK